MEQQHISQCHYLHPELSPTLPGTTLSASREPAAHTARTHMYSLLASSREPFSNTSRKRFLMTRMFLKEERDGHTAGWAQRHAGRKPQLEAARSCCSFPSTSAHPPLEPAGHSSSCCPHPPASPGVCRNVRIRLAPPEAFLLAARSLIFYPCRTELLTAGFPASSSRRCAPWDHPLSPFSTQRHCGPADPTAGRAGDLPSSASGLELLTPPFSSPLQGASKGRLKRPRREAQADGCPPTHQGPLTALETATCSASPSRR